VGLDLPLDIRGTAFQQRVWKALQQIPVGSTASYADIARLRRKLACCRDSVPPRHQKRRRSFRLSLGSRT
jgi:O6-methylguanine-DNA--protein-cysteine methyltransferase